MPHEQIFSDLYVLEPAGVLAGPLVGQFFAELGAKVCKIENPHTGGDVTRGWKLPSETTQQDFSAYFSAANWGKQSISLDLKTQTDAFDKLVAQADVIIVNFKPGDAQKLHADYERLSKINPSLIYGHITGYGNDDARVGYDALIQAESGFTYMNGEENPVKMPVALIDILAAHQLKEALLLALLQRAKTGKGSYIKVSLFDTAVASLANQATNWLCAKHIPQRIGNEHPNIVPYGKIFHSAENEGFVLAVGSDGQFAKLCQFLELEELSVKFPKNVQRVQNREEVHQTLTLAFRQRHIGDILVNLQKLHIPVGKLRSMDEVFAQQAAKRLILERADESSIKGLRTFVAEADFLPRKPLDKPPHLL
ncbi:MAG: CoA transferase [Bernardetiaceae bacterium]|nr:CoA transferase [Bernardetiaceae bacterium]